MTSANSHHTPTPDELGVLAAVPAALARSRVALHRLAAYVVAPARYRVTERFGLRWVPGGFGTPVFGEDQQIVITADGLVVRRGDEQAAHPITTLNDAARHVGGPIDADTAAEHDTPPLGDATEVLEVDPDHVGWLSQWWGIGIAALETVRAEPATEDPGEVQLWPGHLDGGVEFGDADRRASYGVSAGDDGHPEPYLYVSLWWPDRVQLTDDGFWNSTSFTGAVMPASALVGHDDPVGVATRFFAQGRDLLAAAAVTPASS
jgi:hypothetical protein